MLLLIEGGGSATVAFRSNGGILSKRHDPVGTDVYIDQKSERDHPLLRALVL
ncbi:hypothetical protein [Noviherbaspirillum sp. ST9]|uniref:hypothetical protein n=1 Tax=Noviherbaspirillum sp. ST9 TaxID=3401606 RepID=UPI003B5867FE